MRGTLRRSLTPLLWAVAVALAVAVVGKVYLDRHADETTSTVFVARQLIPVGTFVRPSMFAIETVPRAELEAGALTDIRYIALHHVAHPIYPGEQFSASDFSP